MKTKYKALQILILFVASAFFLSIAFLWYQKDKGQQDNGMYLFFVVVTIFLVYIFFKRAPVVVLSDDDIKVKCWFKTYIYDWFEVKEVFLSNKEYYSVFFIFGQYLEATSIKIENGNKIVLWDQMYGNLDEIRLFISNKIRDKIKDPLAEIKNSVLHFIDKKKYAGNPFISLNTLLIAGIVVFFLFQFNNADLLNPKFFLVLIVPVILYIGFGFQMHYFIIDKDSLIIKNHYFPWKIKKIDLNDIFEMDIETPHKHSRSLRVLTKNYQSKLYGAGSLSGKNWDEFRNDLMEIGIPVRKD